MHETIELLQRHGLKLIEIEDLPDPVCFVTTQRVVLMRAGMSEDARKDAIEWVLFAAVTTRA